MRQVFSHHPGPRSFLEKTDDVTVVGECWDATKYGVGRQNRLYQCLEESGQRPRMVRRLNIDGDGQGDLAGHGGEHQAVFVYRIESYNYWQRGFGREEFTYGQFGRTLQSRACLTQTCASAIATGLVKLYSRSHSPRVTCYRVGIRMKEPRMAALLVAHASSDAQLFAVSAARYRGSKLAIASSLSPLRPNTCVLGAINASETAFSNLL